MANSIQYDWSLYCATEGVNKNITQKPRPTQCPDDSSHTIVPEMTTYSLSQAPNNLLSKAQKQGYYGMEGVSFPCPANTTTTYDKIFPYDITILLGHMFNEDANTGDELNILLTPSLTCGVLTQNATTGDTKVYVSSTAINLIVKGVYLNFTNSTDKYYVKEVDLMESSVTLATALLDSYSIGTLVKRTVQIVKNLVLPSKQVVTIGRNNPSSTYIPAGYIFRFVYENKTGVDKTFNFMVEYY